MKFRLLTLLVGLSLMPAPVTAVSWTSFDSEENGWWVRGGAIHHETYERDRTEAAVCENCHWWVHRICDSWTDENHGWCPSMRLRCPRDMSIVEIFRANALRRPNLNDSRWVRSGYSCIGEAGPISYGQISERISESNWIEPPPLKVTVSPPEAAIVNLPVKIKYLSPSLTPLKTFKVAGHLVRFQSRASRTLNCSYCIKTATQVRWQQTGSDTLDFKTNWTADVEVAGLVLQPDLGVVSQAFSLKFRIKKLTRKLIG